MNVSLTPELERIISEKVSSGLYNNASEVVREALRLYFEEQETRRLKIEHLRRLIQEGIDDVEAGRVQRMTPELLEDIKRRGLERMEKRRKAS